MSDYTFYVHCWQCTASEASRDYGEACDWMEAHEKQNAGHRTEMDDVPDEVEP